MSCDYPWFSKKIFLQTAANLYSVNSDIWLILLRMLYIRNAIILINSKYTRILSQLVTSLKRTDYSLTCLQTRKLHRIRKQRTKREELSYRGFPFLTQFVSGFIYLMLHTEVWVYSSFVVVPAAYFKSLVNKRIKLSVWIIHRVRKIRLQFDDVLFFTHSKSLWSAQLVTTKLAMSQKDTHSACWTAEYRNDIMV
jgi:hypothetical protein